METSRIPPRFNPYQKCSRVCVGVSLQDDWEGVAVTEGGAQVQISSTQQVCGTGKMLEVIVQSSKFIDLGVTDLCIAAEGNRETLI